MLCKNRSALLEFIKIFKKKHSAKRDLCLHKYLKLIYL